MALCLLPARVPFRGPVFIDVFLSLDFFSIFFLPFLGGMKRFTSFRNKVFWDWYFLWTRIFLYDFDFTFLRVFLFDLINKCVNILSGDCVSSFCI